MNYFSIFKPYKFKPYKFKKYKFNGLTIAALCLSLVFIANCSGDKSKKKTTKKEVKKMSLILQKVEIDPPNPTSTDHIRALPILKDKTMRHVKFKYMWYVNGDFINEADTGLLDKEYYKKGDSIYCKIKATRGPLESEQVSSDKVEVGNSPPVIELTPVDSFKIPGRFSYQIQATDPDEDALSYYLIQPTEWSIIIDKDTGLITWDVPDLPVGETESTESAPTEDEESEGRSSKKTSQTETQRRLPQTMVLVFEIHDADGAITPHKITLQLSKQGGSEEAR